MGLANKIKTLTMLIFFLFQEKDQGTHIYCCLIGCVICLVEKEVRIGDSQRRRYLGIGGGGGGTPGWWKAWGCSKLHIVNAVWSC